jgi:MFS family permease
MEFKSIFKKFIFITGVSLIILLGQMIYELMLQKSRTEMYPTNMYIITSLIIFFLILNIIAFKIKNNLKIPWYKEIYNRILNKKKEFTIYSITFLIISIFSYYSFNGSSKLSTFVISNLTSLLMLSIIIFFKIISDNNKILKWILIIILLIPFSKATYLTLYALFIIPELGLGAIVLFFTIPISIITGICIFFLIKNNKEE